MTERERKAKEAAQANAQDGDNKESQDEEGLGSGSDFGRMALLAVARASFCGNPPYDPLASQNQVDPEGMPLCTDRDNFERQKDRIKLLKISQGSIVMQFEVTANRTETEISAVNIFGVLERKLADPKSDFRHDVKFGRFASVASLEEIEFSEAVFEREVRQAEFEEVRSRYDEENYCELHNDSKNNIDTCVKDFAYARVSVQLLPMVILALSFIM